MLESHGQRDSNTYEAVTHVPPWIELLILIDELLPNPLQREALLQI